MPGDDCQLVIILKSKDHCHLVIMLKTNDHCQLVTNNIEKQGSLPTRRENIPMPKVIGHILLLKRTNENTEPTVRPKKK